jgi:aspartate/methionine/tyrosine aminotransferase
VKYRPELAAVTESPMVKIATAAESMPGSIKLCYGESDMPTPAFICEAAHEAALGGHTFYTHTAGYTELREAIATKVHALHGVTYRGSEIMSTVGGSMAIYAAIRACVGAGNNAVIVSPAYAIFSNGVIMAGGEPRPASLARDGRRFRLDLDRVAAAIDRDTRMLIVNSPSNPTGWMISVEEQQALAELAERHDLVILSDEVYERLIYDEAHVAPSFARVIDNKDRLIVINSFSKTYNMTGWRLGWAQSSEATIKTMYKAVEFMTSNATAMVQQAGIIALRDGEPYIQELRAHYARRREQVMASLSSIPGVSLPEPQGAFYAFPRIERVTDSTSFALRLLADTGLAVAPGAGFGSDGEGYIRVCFAATEATVTAALERFCSFVTSGRS